MSFFRILNDYFILIFFEMNHQSNESNLQRKAEEIWVLRAKLNKSSNQNGNSKKKTPFICQKNKIVHYSPFLIEGKLFIKYTQ